LDRWFQKHPPKIQPAFNAVRKDELRKSHWDRERARVDHKRAQFALDVAKRKYVQLDEICGAVGQMLPDSARPSTCYQDRRRAGLSA